MRKLIETSVCRFSCGRRFPAPLGKYQEHGCRIRCAGSVLQESSTVSSRVAAPPPPPAAGGERGTEGQRDPSCPGLPGVECHLCILAIPIAVPRHPLVGCGLPDGISGGIFPRPCLPSGLFFGEGPGKVFGSLSIELFVFLMLSAHRLGSSPLPWCLWQIFSPRLNLSFCVLGRDVPRAELCGFNTVGRTTSFPRLSWHHTQARVRLLLGDLQCHSLRVPPRCTMLRVTCGEG